ncbi:MAG: carboxypeptidase-like regulatory domain-containing protein [Acidobacteriaceae bacterium]
MPASSQEITGSVVVTVTDNTGASVSGAKLLLTRTATGDKISGITHSDGSYTYATLQTGIYTLSVVAPGFKSTNFTNIDVNIGEHVGVPVQLTVGSVTQSVVVSGSAISLLNSQSASVGQVVQSQTIQQLPLNGRDFIQLLYLATGAAPVGEGDSPSNTWTGRSDTTVIMAGLRETDVSYLVNGIETRNARFGTAGLFLSPDAIQEFRVQRTTFGAEFGLSAAVVNMALRAGTNNIHGDVFELNRNRDYAANSYFLNQEGLPRPPFNQNNFGATIAAPVVIPKLYDGKNRSFYMFNFEAFRQIQGNVMTGNYPSRAQLAGNLADDSTGMGIYPLNSAFCTTNPGSLKCANVTNPSTGLPYPGNVIPSSQLNPVDQIALPYIPTPNVTVAAGNPAFPAYNTIASPSITQHTNQYNARIDQTITQKDNINATFSDYNSIVFQPSLQPLGGYTLPIADHLWTATYNHIFTPNVMNDIRLGLNNSNEYLNPVTAYGPNYAQSLFGLTNTNTNPLTYGIPDFGISGIAGIGSWSEVIGAQDINYQLTDNVTVSKGSHNYMAGVELIHTRFRQTTDFSANPNFTFDGRFTGTQLSGFGLGDFLLGIPYQASGAVGDSGQNLHTNYYGVYARDNWQATHNLTLSYGLRYEYSLAPIESQNRQAYFDLSTGQQVYAGNGIRRSIIKPDYHNLAPRLGFSWSPSFLHNTVLRGGFGLYYATDNWNELQFSIVGTKYYQVQTINSNPTTPTLSMNNMLPPLATSLNTNPFTLDPNSLTPYYEQWGLDLQHVVGDKYLLELEYAGGIGKDLPQRRNANVATIDPTGTVPIVNRVPFPDFGFILQSWNEGAANWNALTAKAERRYQNGLSFLGSLTYADAIDQGITDDFSAESRDFRRYDRGHSDYTVPVRFVLSGIYDLPFGTGKMLLGGASGKMNYLVGGWQLNTITTLTAGQYTTATLPTDWLNIGAFSQSRPNVQWNLVKTGRNLPNHYFNPAAFVYPSTHIEGNVGRNTLEQPGYANVDLSLFKSSKLYKDSILQFRFEFFNVLNHTQFGGASAGLGAGFGQITSTRSPRIIQLGTRIQW